jgi:hypothetical protein
MGHWYAVSMTMTFGCTLVLLHRPSWPQIWESEFKFSLVKWKWCRYVIFEANYHLRPFHTSKLDISVWAIGMLSQGHLGSSLYSCIGQIGPKYGNSGLLVEWKWCHYIMFEADIHLGPLPKSILDIQTTFWAIVMLSQQGHMDALILILLHQPSWPQIRELWCVPCGVGIML